MASHPLHSESQSVRTGLAKFRSEQCSLMQSTIVHCVQQSKLKLKKILHINEVVTIQLCVYNRPISKQVYYALVKTCYLNSFSRFSRYLHQKYHIVFFYIPVFMIHRGTTCTFPVSVSYNSVFMNNKSVD